MPLCFDIASRRTFAWLAVFAFTVLSLAALSPAQEYYESTDKMTQKMFKPVPDAVRYRFFLRQVAVFERQARVNEANGRDGQALRNHFIHKFGLTPDELKQVTDIALDYDNKLGALRAQAKQIAAAFRAQNFPDGSYQRGTALPAEPPELHAIHVGIHKLSLQSRDKIHTTLGDARFAQFDLMLRTHGATDIRVVHPDGAIDAPTQR